MGLLSRIFSKWFSSDNENDDVTQTTFGNVVKFRVGSTVSIGATFTIMLNDGLFFKEHFGNEDLSAMIVDTVLSFDFDGTKVYRLYCRNPECMVQLQEEPHERVSYMLFFLTQDIPLQDQNMYKEWVSSDDAIMKSPTIEDELNGETIEFQKVFGPVQYRENVEADASGVERESSLSKSMTLFDRGAGDGVEYVLFDAELDNYVVEGFSGVNVPYEEVTIL